MPFSTAEESRLRELLRTVDIGLMASPAGDESSELAQLRREVASLRQQRNTGNVMGGMLRTEIAPGAYTVGPYRQDLDATHPVAFDLWIPDWLLRIKRCQMRIKPAAVRSSVAVASSSTGTPSGGGATSGASSASTTPSGGGSTSGASSTSTTPSGGGATSGSANALDGHHHLVFSYVNDGDSSWTYRRYDAFRGDVVPPTTPSDGVNINAEEARDIITGPNQQTATATHSHSTPNHTHDISHTHSTPAHSHDISHTHTTPDHTHPAHTHTLTLAIAEGGSATDLEFSIDGIDRTAALGGPWNAAAVVDITEYLIDNRMVPEVGAHPVEISSASVGAVEVWFDFYVVVKAIQ